MGLPKSEIELEEIRKALPMGDSCMNCQGVARGPSGEPCWNCGGTDIEPHLTECVKQQFIYFDNKCKEANAERDRLFNYNAEIRIALKALVDRVRELDIRVHDFGHLNEMAHAEITTLHGVIKHVNEETA